MPGRRAGGIGKHGEQRAAAVSLRAKNQSAARDAARNAREDDSQLMDTVRRALYGETVAPSSTLEAIATWVDEGAEEKLDSVVSSGGLAYLAGILRTPDQSHLHKDACWVSANLFWYPQYLDAAVEAGLVREVVSCLHDRPYAVRKEALWAVLNVTDKGERTHVAALHAAKALPHVLGFLSVPDVAAMKPGLSALYNFLWWGRELEEEGEAPAANVYRKDFVHLGGLEKAEKLQEHANDDVHEAALAILEDFFGEDIEAN
ncbi:Importin subunit alpha-1 [Diplonema papillatum]|nr:Importin subunit alpha-1 [Diplonema papillatum]|eukprot:gene6975-10741_t